MEPFDVEKYLSNITPQARAWRDETERYRRSFLDSVKRYVADKGLTPKDYDRIMIVVEDALDI